MNSEYKYYLLFLLGIALSTSVFGNESITVLKAVYGTHSYKAPGHNNAYCPSIIPDNKQLKFDSKVTWSSDTNAKGLGGKCNGKQDCSYVIPSPTVEKDPAFGCYKEAVINYYCGNDETNYAIEFAGGPFTEAAGTTLYLACNQFAVLTFTNTTSGSNANDILTVNNLTYRKDPASQYTFTANLKTLRGFALKYPGYTEKQISNESGKCLLETNGANWGGVTLNITGEGVLNTINKTFKMKDSAIYIVTSAAPPAAIAKSCSIN